ncbi:hypothetical protein E3J95_05490 [Candidatus Aerophobetes bacterium]|uniref:Uncharacterized protein n=1 Tax=Aerophobetes bacterium TaxID=2030807 RepID=A0A523QHM1_UNCAE|nr:MAG: hypothetical protein E3J95_05490 [Candidatus Aerophobetes bacterium]TET58536.1 MAG: hypothetical protein E3J48_08790 [Candidatus Aerophobetes bacterium]
MMSEAREEALRRMIQDAERLISRKF